MAMPILGIEGVVGGDNSESFGGAAFGGFEGGDFADLVVEIWGSVGIAIWRSGWLRFGEDGDCWWCNFGIWCWWWQFRGLVSDDG